MSVYAVKTRGSTIKQGRIASYSIDFNVDIENIGIKLEGFLAKPKEGVKNAIFDSFNEVMRENCYNFIEKYGLTSRGGGEITGGALYNTIMGMIVDTINEIDDRGDSLFMAKVSDTQLRKASKNRNKVLTDELEKQKKYDAELEIEIAKQKIMNETKEQVLRSMKPIEQPNVTIEKTAVVETIKVQKLEEYDSIGMARASSNPGSLWGS